MIEPLPPPTGFALDYNIGFGWARVTERESLPPLLKAARAYRTTHPHDDLRCIALMPSTNQFGQAFETIAYVWPRGVDIKNTGNR